MQGLIKFVVLDTVELKERIANYFKQFDFKLVANQSDSLQFKRKSTLLDTWKRNPLKWGSTITISISDNIISADFSVDTSGQMNTKEEMAVWQIFIENFQDHFASGLSDNNKLNAAITENKKSRITYILWVVVGILTGVLLCYLLNSFLSQNKTLPLITIPIWTSIFLKWKIGLKKTTHYLS